MFYSWDPRAWVKYTQRYTCSHLLSIFLGFRQVFLKLFFETWNILTRCEFFSVPVRELHSSQPGWFSKVVYKTSHSPRPLPPLSRRDLSWFRLCLCVNTHPLGTVVFAVMGLAFGSSSDFVVIHDVIAMNTLVQAFLLAWANAFPGETVKPTSWGMCVFIARMFSRMVIAISHQRCVEGASSYLSLGQFNRWKCYFVVFSCISLVTDVAERLFMWPLGTCISFSGNRWFITTAHCPSDLF